MVIARNYLKTKLFYKVIDSIKCWVLYQKKDQYEAKLVEILQSDQLKAMINTYGSVVLKKEKNFKEELSCVKKATT